MRQISFSSDGTGSSPALHGRDALAYAAPAGAEAASLPRGAIAANGSPWGGFETGALAEFPARPSPGLDRVFAEEDRRRPLLGLAIAVTLSAAVWTCLLTALF